MVLVRAEIEIINSGDLEMVRRHQMDIEDVKRMTVTMLVDSGAYHLCINEVMQEQLDLPVIDKKKAQLADGSIRDYDVVGPIDVRFKNRKFITEALVLPGDSEPLLGAIPMEGMDLIIHPLRQELLVNPEHPYFAQMSLKGLK